MCLAIPMRVVGLLGGGAGGVASEMAVVEVDGMSKAIRLDLLEEVPSLGEYLIVHAGFAIHVLNAGEAEENLALMRELLVAMDSEAGGES